VIKVHHLNLCTMCPFGGRFLSGGSRSIIASSELVVHALLVETPKDGLVLVDTGMGLEDVRSPIRRLGPGFVGLARPRLREEDTAVRQVERLGFSRSDVRHVVVTHLDPDHAGGINDFPNATIHVHRIEHDAAIAPQSVAEKYRYRKPHLLGSSTWRLHEGSGGDAWFGFDSIRIVAEDVVLIPLPGHTRGHAAIAVRVSETMGPEWLVHCGDAYFFHLEKDDPTCCPPVLQNFQRVIAVDDELRKSNAKRLRDLHRQQGRKVRLFCAHDPTEYRALAELTPPRT
jgi:glyoxylase-like metal-dependent hydrolase (beta-lactamase superfamily II)